MSDEQSFQTILVVYLGPIALEGGKMGHIFIPAATLDKIQDDGLALQLARRLASPFSKAKASVVGGIYSAEGVLEDDTVTSIRPSSVQYQGRSAHFLIPSFELAAAGEARAVRIAKAEKKAKASPGVMGEIRELALFLNRLPTMDRFAAEAAVLDLIRREASELRKGKSR